MLHKNGQKKSLDYYCEKCDYGSCKKSAFNQHLTTAKHQNATNATQMLQKNVCECGKFFQHHSSYYRHKKTCINKTNEGFHNNIITSELIIEIIKQNQEFKEIIIEQNKQNVELQKQMLEVCKNTTITNSNNISNSNNKAFNLNFFLNETCKDAMNITDFVNSIELQISDLERVGELGYVEGLSNIIARNLKELDITQRPVHCTDKKREIMYVKDENTWEKDEERKKMHKLVKKVADKNIKLLPQYRELYPDYTNASSLRSDQYNQIFLQALGGSGDNDFEKEEKIIQKVSKEVLVEKSQSL